ncbi:MAG: STAS-like domain-containing protein [Bacteroidales bacterium]|nr:STAS-like domain-containing protein [Bacteroidales bacterium]
MVTFSFIQFGENLGTRQLGKVAREKLMPLLNDDEKVVLDFTGINVVSNSFADECIAKLLIDMPLETLKARTTFKGLNPLAENCVLTAIKRRYAALCMA